MAGEVGLHRMIEIHHADWELAMAELRLLRADVAFIREALEELQPVIHAYVPEPGTPAGWALKRKLDKLAKKEAPHG